MLQGMYLEVYLTTKEVLVNIQEKTLIKVTECFVRISAWTIKISTKVVRLKYFDQLD